MMRRFLFAAVLAAASSLFAATAEAQWSANPAANNPICTELNNQRFPHIISDGAGGAIICWEDERTGLGAFDIYAQRIDKDGNIRWTRGGVPVCTSVGEQKKPVIATDGKGGAIIAWTDVRYGDNDVYVQRIDSTGAALWQTNGIDLVPQSLQPIEQDGPSIVSDGMGGAIVGWLDHLPNGNNYCQVFTNRVDANGNTVWGEGGYVAPNPNNDDLTQYNVMLCPDGDAGAFFIWQWRLGSYYDIYSQWVKKNGAFGWTYPGVKVCDNDGDQNFPANAADGLGGEIVLWNDVAVSPNANYCNRVDPSGSLKWPGRKLNLAGGQISNGSICAMGNGTAVIVWEDSRGGTQSDIYAQYFDENGNEKWTKDGVLVCNAPNKQMTPVATPDGAGGVVIVWEDRRASTLNSDLWAQRLDANGNALWQTNGVAISTAPNAQSTPVIIPDDHHGAIIAWEDYRASFSNSGIYAMRVLDDGTFPKSAPAMQMSTHVLDFGSVAVGKPKDKTVIMTNAGGDTLRITSTSSDNPAFTVEPATASIEPGMTLNLTIHFTPPAVGGASAKITILSNSWTSPDSVRVTGSGVGTGILSLSANSITFDRVKVGLRQDSTVVFSNPGVDTLKVTAINTSNAAFSASTTTFNILPGKTFDNVIRFSPKVSGFVKGRLLIQNNGPSSPDTLFLNGIGYAEVDILLTPTSVAFGKVPVGSFKDSVVAIKNNGNDTLRVSLVESDTRQFTVRPSSFNVNPKATYNLNVRFAPEFVGMVSGQLTMYSNSTTTPDKIVVSGNGNADVILSATSIGFGTVDIGKTKDTVITIRNLRMDSLRVTDVSCDVAAFQARPRVFNVGPGQTFSDTLSFVPTAIGSTGGTISIVSNSSTSPDKIVVTGEGRLGPDAAEAMPQAVAGFELQQNYPNPFNPTTLIPYMLYAPAHVRLHVENALGQTVATLLDSEEAPGAHRVAWDAADHPAGVYKYVLTVGNRTASGTMVLLK